jgi:tetratricopeptide (TPR) repeat protein
MQPMARFRCHALLGVAVLVTAGAFLRSQTPADPEAAIDSALRIQKAMARADACLLAGDAAQAVEALEAELPRINGNRKYLAKLRDAYRAYIPKLYADNQPSLAKRYLERLCILDHTAASDKSLQPTLAETKTTLEVPKALCSRPPLTLVEMAQASGLSSPKTPVARGTMEDPFDRANAAKGSTDLEAKRKLAQDLLAQAEAEFRERHFTRAHYFFEQADRIDPSATAGSRDRWAYCKLSRVVEQLNRTDLDQTAWTDLERDVQKAVELAPLLAETGRKLEQEIRNRRGSSGRGGQASIRHLGTNAQGWEVAETANFRIFHKQSRVLVEKAAQVMEQTRAAMSQKWLGKSDESWNPKCDVFLHATAMDYCQVTRQSPDSPGHASIEQEKGSSKILTRRMDMHCDNPQMLETVLPHETTHIVLAGKFGNSQVPRWADEGMAVLTEPPEKVGMHRRNLARCWHEGQLFAVRDLMQLDKYPDAQRISAFYAQSVSLVDFLSRQRGPVVFAQFLRDGLRDGYEPALTRHYGFRDFADLEQRWSQQELAGFGPATATAGLK